MGRAEMTFELLLVVALGQTAFILLLLLAMTVRRVVLVYGAKRAERIRGAVLEELRKWVAGQGEEAAIRRLLDHSDEDAVAGVLKQAAIAIDGDRWEELLAIVRKTAWFERMLAYTSSRLWWRRLAAARCLAMMGRAEDLSVVRRLLGDPNRIVRVAAFGVLGRIVDAGLVRHALTEALTAGGVQRRYIFSALRRHPEELANAVAERLGSPLSADAAAALISLVAEVGDTHCYEPVLAASASLEPEVRAAAAHALGRFPHPRSRDALMWLLADADASVRARAAHALGIMRAGEAVRALEGALDDPNEMVRLHAAMALRSTGGEGLRALRRVREEGGGTADIARYILALDEQAMTEYDGYGVSA
jgi:HEAT repeat protein